MSRLQMMVNGKPVDLELPESRFLSEVSREDLGLTGTKIGCNEAECGICTVLVNGTPVVSCVFPSEPSEMGPADNGKAKGPPLPAGPLNPMIKETTGDVRR